MEKIKVAYIDYTTYGTLMVLQLRENGIGIVGADSLDDFLSRHNLKEFPVLLIHPGRGNQPLVPKLVKDFPHIKIALTTSPTSEGDYFGSDIPAFGYSSIRAIEEFIRENQ